MRNRLTTVIIGAVSLTLTWLFFAWMPLSRQMADVSAQTAAAKAEIADYNSTIAQLPTLMLAARDLDNQKRHQRSSLYAKADLLKLFDKLDADARLHGLSVTAITPPIEEMLTLNRSVQNQGDPAFLNITMKLRGDYYSFSRFVLDLETAPYFRGVTACQILDENSEPGRLQCTIGFRALLGESEGSL